MTSCQSAGQDCRCCCYRWESSRRSASMGQYSLSRAQSPRGSLPPTAVSGSFAFKAHPHQESAKSPLPLACLRPPLCCFFGSAGQLSGRYPGQPFQGRDARRTNPAKHMDTQLSEANSWPTDGLPLCSLDNSSDQETVSATHRHFPRISQSLRDRLAPFSHTQIPLLGRPIVAWVHASTQANTHLKFVPCMIKYSFSNKSNKSKN